MNDLIRWAGTLAIAAALSGCAVGSNPRDPFEGFNRAMFTFNDKVDQVALKPVATAYQDYLPSFVQTGVGNFFSNIGDVWTAVNNLLQGKMADGVTDIMRVAINSTFGLLGLIDIGSDAGMPKHKQDFGATLGVWGIGSGPYVVLPFLGPSTLRDTAALPVDWQGDLWQYTFPVSLRNSGIAMRVIDQRAAVLNASNLIEDAALDRYEFIRDGYLQRREGKIRDGGDSSSRDDDSAMNASESKPRAVAGADDAGPKSGEEPNTGSAVKLSTRPDDAGLGTQVPAAELSGKQEKSGPQAQEPEKQQSQTPPAEEKGSTVKPVSSDPAANQLNMSTK